MKYLCLLFLTLLFFFSCEKPHEETPSKNRLDAREYIFDGVEFVISDYQISSNLISFQIKITNNSENIVFIPRSVSIKNEMHYNELIITKYYTYDDLGWIPAHDIYPQAFIIEPKETNYYSVSFQNFEATRIIDIGKYEEMMSFDDLIGTAEKIEITLGFFINHRVNYLTDNFEEYDFFKIRNELQIITLEASINDSHGVNNEIRYKYINK
jgi:uncharacterized protein YcfL